MNKKLLAVLLGAGLVLAACGGSDEETTDNKATSNENATTETASGDAEKIYTQKCSSCHNADLSGGVGPTLQTIGAKLSKEDIEGVIANGQGAMPPKLIEGDDAAAVAEWLANKK